MGASVCAGYEDEERHVSRRSWGMVGGGAGHREPLLGYRFHFAARVWGLGLAAWRGGGSLLCLRAA
jgi:hypothetical protein